MQCGLGAGLLCLGIAGTSPVPPSWVVELAVGPWVLWRGWGGLLFVGVLPCVVLPCGV